MILFRLLLPALVLFAASCTGNNPPAVPRPVAYPRICVYDSVYTLVPQLPVDFSASTGAVASVSPGRDGAVWLNLFYPAYNATLHCTITPVSPQSAPAVIANRNERMSLNSGALPTEVTELSSPSGFKSRILLTPTGTATPVQFLSVSPEWVLSGALYFSSPVHNHDSIAPVLKAVRRDLIHAAQTLQ